MRVKNSGYIETLHGSHVFMSVAKINKIRTITFDAWFHERRMIVREADFHGVTDELLGRMGES